MSRADEIYRATCLDILENGFYDTGYDIDEVGGTFKYRHTIFLYAGNVVFHIEAFGGIDVARGPEQVVVCGR